MLKNNAIMQNKTILFQKGTQMISPEVVNIINVLMNPSEQISNIKDLVDTWLDGKSNYAMKVAQLNMSRRAVILLHFALLSLLVGIAMVETNMVATFILSAITYVLVSKFNKCVQKDEKGN